MTQGKLVVGMGLPGSGKSSLFAALNSLLVEAGWNSTLYREPEAEQWPDAVNSRELCGYISALTWFRSARVPGLFKADTDRREGRIALVDSYYDKLVHLYFDKPGFEWLMPTNDPYRSVYKDLISQDYHSLPDADCVVTVTVTQERWRENVKGRGRELDRASNVLDTFATQEYFLSASREFCESRGIPHVVFSNCETPIARAVKSLERELLKVGVIATRG